MSTQADEKTALINLFKSCGGESWKRKRNWCSLEPLSSCDNVKTDSGKIISLDLSVEKLTGSIPEAIGKLTSLTELILFFLGAIPEAIGNLTSLTRLDLSQNQLTGSIPEAIGKLTSLTELILWGNQLTGAIPEAIGNLTNLTRLDLSQNQLTGSIPEAIGKLTSLIWLSLGNNKLTGAIPEAIGNLTSLTRLDLSQNQLTGSIPEAIGKLTSLTELILWGNQLTGSIPEAIGKLTSLIWLSLGSNKLTGSIPEAIGKLTSLTALYLYNNQLTGSIPEAIGNLTSLTELVLHCNQLTGSIPEAIGNLTRLIRLDLSSNKLTGGWVNLRGLLTLVTLQIDGELTALLQLPPELKGKQIQTILSYMRDKYGPIVFTKSQHAVASQVLPSQPLTVRVERVKVILSGPGSAGKTTLVERLIKNTFNQSFRMTDGILINGWTLDGIDMQLWDLGGQIIYDTTHSLFFSERCVYMMVYNPRHNDSSSDLERFFQNIRSVSPNAPIVLVPTHSKDATGDSTGFHKKYGPISAVCPIDSSDNSGIEYLKTQLAFTARNLEYVSFDYPIIYQALELALMEYRKNQKQQGSKFAHISRDQFNLVVQSIPGLGVKSAHIALNLQQDWGMVYVLDNGVIVLNPQDLAEVLSCVVTAHKPRIEAFGKAMVHGVLVHSGISRIWKDYPAELHLSFLHLLHSTQTAYPLHGLLGETLHLSIVPSMLQELNDTEDDNLKELYFPPNVLEQPSVEISLQGESLPVRFPAKLLVLMHTMALIGGVWKTGCLLKIDESYAIININLAKQYVTMLAAGSDTRARTAAIAAFKSLTQSEYNKTKIKQIEVKLNGEKEILKLAHFTKNKPLEVDDKLVDISGFAQLFDLNEISIKKTINVAGSEHLHDLHSLVSTKKSHSDCLNSDNILVEIALLKSMPYLATLAGLTPWGVDGILTLWVGVEMHGALYVMPITPTSHQPGHAWKVLENLPGIKYNSEYMRYYRSGDDEDFVAASHSLCEALSILVPITTSSHEVIGLLQLHGMTHKIRALQTELFSVHKWIGIDVMIEKTVRRITADAPNSTLANEIKEIVMSLDNKIGGISDKMSVMSELLVKNFDNLRAIFADYYAAMTDQLAWQAEANSNSLQQLISLLNSMKKSPPVTDSTSLKNIHNLLKELLPQLADQVQQSISGILQANVKERSQQIDNILQVVIETRNKVDNLAISVENIRRMTVDLRSVQMDFPLTFLIRPKSHAVPTSHYENLKKCTKDLFIKQVEIVFICPVTLQPTNSFEFNTASDTVRKLVPVMKWGLFFVKIALASQGLGSVGGTIESLVETFCAMPGLSVDSACQQALKSVLDYSTDKVTHTFEGILKNEYNSSVEYVKSIVLEREPISSDKSIAQLYFTSTLSYPPIWVSREGKKLYERFGEDALGRKYESLRDYQETKAAF